jgi:hypothetical protein
LPAPQQQWAGTAASIGGWHEFTRLCIDEPNLYSPIS